MKLEAVLAALATTVLLAGCSSGLRELPEETAELVPVGGVVTLDGEPLNNAVVQFYPASGGKGGEGGGTAYFGHTDLTGRFDLASPGGRSGAAPGSYTVVISKFARPDGSPFPPDADSGEFAADGVEHVPPKYSDPAETELRATVPQDGKTDFEFPLKK